MLFYQRFHYFYTKGSLMKTSTALQYILLHISKAVINIRSLEDFHTTIMNDIRPHILFDDAVLVLFSEDKKTFTHPLTLSPEQRREHPDYDYVLTHQFDTANTPIENMLQNEEVAYYTLKEWLKAYPTFPGLSIMRDTGLNHSVSLQLKNRNGVFALLVFHFEKKPSQPIAGDFYHGIKDQLAMALSNILANEEIAQEKQFAETLLSISEATTNIRDRDDLYTTIMDKLKLIVHFDDAVAIVLSDDSCNLVQFYNIDGKHDQL